jgi:hypothetical protein
MKLNIILILVMGFSATASFAWNDEETHPTLSEFAAEKYFGPDFMDESVNGDQVRDLIKNGSILEDTGGLAQFAGGTARSLNHFHNASKSTLAEARLSDVPSFIPIGGTATWESTLLWAQDGDNQKTKVQGDWSWGKVRELYFKSLTTSDKSEREQLYADYLTGLGYQMHLIQDMGQPNHVRNDTHVWDGASWVMGFETWARRNDVEIIRKRILNKIPIPAVTVDLKAEYTADPSKVPVANLFDTRGYRGARQPTATFDQGLAEYTNSNFFSENTIFSSEYPANDKHYQPYPRKSETNVQDYINKQMSLTTVTTDDDLGPFDSFLVSKQATTGEKLNCLAAAGPFSRKLYQERGEDKYFYRSFIYDICFPEYAEKLIPASAAYSKALLEYFHRGKIKLTVAAPEDITFRSIKVTAKNDTTDEDMGLGDVSLVIRYKALAETPLGGGKYLLNNPPEGTSTADYTYKVIKLSKKIDLKDATVLTFDLSSDILPLYFDDMTMQLVYKGPLGKETDAVAVSQLEKIDSVYSDFDVSLPPSGVYAKVSGDSVDGTFDELRVTALTDIPGGLSGGTFSLALDYRLATSDPFQSHQVATGPDGAVAYIVKVPVKNGVNSLSQGVPTELVFNLSSVSLPVKATNVYLNVVYNRSSDNKSSAIGHNDISEPTPIDVFNNADKVCIDKKWYDAGMPETIALVDTNHNQIAEELDVYAHNVAKIFYKASSAADPTLASSSNYTFSSPDVLIGGSSPRRLGFILTDYDFRLSVTEEWQNTSRLDPWITSPVVKIFNGVAVNNQENYPIMTSFRTFPLWQGGRFVFANTEDEDSECGWDKLNQ